MLVEVLTDPEIEQLITQNVGLAYKAANTYARQYGADQDDAEQTAMTGLVKAAMAFDPDRGVKFSSVAYRYIDTELKHMVAPQVVAHKHSKKGWRLGRVDLDAPFGDEEEDAVHDIVGALDPSHQEVVDKDTYALMNQEIEKLDPRAQSIVKLWSQGMTYRDIAKQLGISHMYVGNLLKQSLEKLRSVLQSA